MRINRGEHEKKRRNKGEGIFSENGKNLEKIFLAPSTYYLSMKNININRWLPKKISIADPCDFIICTTM